MTTLQDSLQAALTSAYTIERELGGGAMSRVVVAEERALARRVVVKVLSPDLAAGVSGERFKCEILLTARLQHPHIVPVLNPLDPALTTSASHTGFVSTFARAGFKIVDTTLRAACPSWILTCSVSPTPPSMRRAPRLPVSSKAR